MESKKELIPSQPSDSRVKKEHENVHFIRTPKKTLEEERKEEEIEEKLKTLLEDRYEKIEAEKEKLKREKINKDLSKTEILDLSDINNTGVIPTISLKEYKKEKEEIKLIDESKKKEDLLNKTKKIETVSKKLLEESNPTPVSISLFDNFRIKNKKIAKEEEIERKRKEKELAKKAIEDKKLEKELLKKEKKFKVSGINADDMKGLSKKGEKEDKKQKALAEKKRKREEKEKLIAIEDAKRKEKLRIEFEEKAKLKKEE